MRATLFVIAMCGLAGCYSPDLPECAPDCQAGLELVLSGRGTLVVQPLDVECKSGDDGKECGFDTEIGLDLTVRAEDGHGYRFDGWTTANCDGQDDECLLVVEAPTTLVGARFIDDGDGGDDD